MMHFFDQVQAFINRNALEAVDDRRHSDSTHMALAISARDLIEQVSKDLPGGTEVPNENYLRLQFWPKNAYYKSAVQYTGRFNVKYMVQSRQVRSHHVDSHYAAAIFLYVRQFCIKFRTLATCLSLDDKHQVKVGEPGYPVAAVERGRQVLVAKEKPFCVGDHDFTKFKVTPSVALDIQIPGSIDKSFYDGPVYVTLKNTVLQYSSPFRHMAEISDIISVKDNPILAVYSDGGGDHRVTFLSVQLGLVALFVKHKLSYVVAGRCAPCQSYIDPVERVMSLLNLGLQSVGVMRQEMESGYEKQIKGLSCRSDIRDKASKSNQLYDKIVDSLKPVIDLLGSTLSRLFWKEKQLKIQEAASNTQIQALYDILVQIDPRFDKNNMQQKHLNNYPVIQKFMETHTQRTHYLFCIKRCQSDECEVCSMSCPESIPEGLLDSLQLIPLPIPDDGANADHYKSFEELWGSVPSEKFRPSLGRSLDEGQSIEVPFSVSGENVRGLVKCEICRKPRCYYSRTKLTVDDLVLIQNRIDDVEYTCGGQLFQEEPIVVYMEVKITCESQVSSHYFNKRRAYDPVCYICGDTEPLEIPEEVVSSHASAHPVCSECHDKGFKPRLRKKTLLGKRKN